ncbi:organic cation transporter protein-like [Lytechinus variegatus]|uniref:organic cation transporter protein-like n=1 Tax=Lytechinus variegatus TaxID=7654 RepID=UPI001BB17BEE|nr:organic cation transporter protein-like [Lytechinus variegatus]
MEQGGMNFDEILLKVGEFGRYQIYIYNILCLFMFVPPWHTLAIYFLSGTAEHWCKIPEWDSVDCENLGFNSTRECIFAKREVGIPSNLSSNGGVVFDQCHRYDVGDTAFNSSLRYGDDTIIPCDAGWEYDVDYSTSTIDLEFDLVCGASYLPSVSQSLFFAGGAVGSVVVGFVADRIGRKPTTFICLAIASTSGVIMAFSVNIWMFLIFRTLTGAFIFGVSTVSYVFANEFVGPSKRNVSGGFAWVYFSCGYMCLALLAYFIRKWRHLQLVISIAPLSLFAFYMFLPESVRWLLSQDRTDEAAEIISKISHVNRVSDPLAGRSDLNSSDRKSKPEEIEQKFTDLLRLPLLRKYFFNVMFNWIVNTIVYYGLSLSTNTLGVNIYIAFAIAGAVEIPGNLVVIYPIKYFGRRPSYVFFMLVGGVACLATIFIPLGPWRITAAMVGKFAITASFNIIFLLACEIFPTPVRNSALGICRLGSNVSSILCPIILLLDNIWKPLPLTVFGTMTLLAGGLAIHLPETQGKKLPETLEEGENIGWKAQPRNGFQRAPPVAFSELKQDLEDSSE